jgi:uncharacterized protein
MIVDDRQRVIGKVVEVAADRFKVEMLASTESFRVVGYDDVHYVARLGSFVMIPVQADHVVAEVVGLSERELGRREPKEGRDLDKTMSARYLELVPMGTLSSGEGFRFGVSVFPTLYADALYATDADLDRIFEVDFAEEEISEQEERNNREEPMLGPRPTRMRAIDIGRSVVFTGYDLKVRVDSFFGGHVAVLGNTGSGKSCTVASIVQSVFSKESEYAARGATFVVLDINGEYRKAFSELPGSIRRLYLKVGGNVDAAAPEPLDSRETTFTFRLPHWFMSVEEWELLLKASERTQRPVLRAALGLATLFSRDRRTALEAIKDHILASCLLHIVQSDAATPSKKDRITGILSSFGTARISLNTVRPMIQVSYGEMRDLPGLTTLLNSCRIDDVTLPDYKQDEFEFDDLGKALDLALLYEEAHGNRQIRDYCAQMLTRFKWVREREEFAFLRMDPGTYSEDDRRPDRFVEKFLGLGRFSGALIKTAQVVVVDMNDAEDEVVAVVSAVMSRLVFDMLRKAEPRNRLPINLVLEEAHRYVAERPAGHAVDAAHVFERIAKEGRKYGLFLLVASQRPSELSKTVLSQCSNYVIHRIQNPDDLSHIRQMTPFISDAVLKRLPSIPKQHALIFGNSVNMPTTFRVRDAVPRPKSDDAEISKLWYHREGCSVSLKIEAKSLDAGPSDDDISDL